MLTGGGAELKGLADHMQAAMGRTVRIGRPTGLSGLPDAHSGPAFSTLAGLIIYAQSNPVDLKLGLGVDDAAASQVPNPALLREFYRLSGKISDANNNRMLNAACG